MKGNIKRMLAFGAFLAALYFILRMHPWLEVTLKSDQDVVSLSGNVSTSTATKLPTTHINTTSKVSTFPILQAEKKRLGYDSAAPTSTTIVVTDGSVKGEISKNRGSVNQSAKISPTAANLTAVEKPKTPKEAFAVAFVKVHKTASSSIRDILVRHSKKHGPIDQLGVFPSPYVGGFPGYFRQDQTVSVQSGKTVPWKPGRRANIVWDHWRFHKDNIRRVINPKAKYVTILRDPERQFESAFYYFYSRWSTGTKRRRTNIACWDYPYLFVTEGKWLNFSKYIALANNSLNESAPWFFRSRNSQSYELGLDPMRFDETYVLQEAKTLDDTFDLVLIFDYMLESIILLKDLFKIDWEDVIPKTPKHAGFYTPHTFTEEERAIVRKLTFQDQILYDYFNVSLWRKVDAYGRERMAKDVTYLQNLIDKNKWAGAKEKSDDIQLKSPTRKIVPQRQKKDSHTETMNLIRELTKTKFPVRVETLYDIAHYMVENYGWCPTKF